MTYVIILMTSPKQEHLNMYIIVVSILYHVCLSRIFFLLATALAYVIMVGMTIVWTLLPIKCLSISQLGINLGTVTCSYVLLRTKLYSPQIHLLKA